MYIYIYIYNIMCIVRKYKIYLSCTGSIWAVKLYSLYKCLLCTVIDQDVVFLVPDPCWATVRIGNSRNAEVTEDTKKKWLKQHLFLLFLDNLTVVFSCLTLQDKHNICTLSENIKYICKRLAFLPISKTCTNKLCIFRQCTYIVYLYQ